MGLPPRNCLAARGGGRGAAASHGRRELPDASVSVFALLIGSATTKRRGLPQNQLKSVSPNGIHYELVGGCAPLHRTSWEGVLGRSVVKMH